MTANNQKRGKMNMNETEFIAEYVAPRLIGVLMETYRSLKRCDFGSVGAISDCLVSTIEEEGRTRVLHPLRVALSGRITSPPPVEIAYFLGKDETLKRIGVAIKKLDNVVK